MSNPSQTIILQLAEAINTAYDVYNKLDILIHHREKAIELIQSQQPNWSHINPIFVWESFPDDPSYPTWDYATKSDSKQKLKQNHNYTAPPASQDSLGSSEGPPYHDGWQLFGFTATITKPREVQMNILILRGTVTNYEAGASLWDWDLTSPLAIPTPNGISNGSANVKTGFWDFYAEKGTGGANSLATELKRAINNVNAVSAGLPWYAAAHSLGGAMLCLGIVDALADKTQYFSPTVVTFGSVVVGDTGWATVYNSQVPNSVRIANLCDFVPSLRSLLPGQDNVTYKHVGDSWVFVWQTESDWDNHSMKYVYGSIVASEGTFRLINKATDPNMELQYPVGIVSGTFASEKGT